MRFLEKDLEEIIFYSDPGQLSYRGLELQNGFLLRQVEIPNHGIADLINYVRPSKDQNYHQVNIIELKKDLIEQSTFIQSLKYAEGIRSLFISKGYYVKIYITLIGRDVEANSDFVFAPKLFKQDGLMQVNSIDFYTYSFKLSGFFFDKVNDFYRREKSKSSKVKSLSNRLIFKEKLEL